MIIDSAGNLYGTTQGGGGTFGGGTIYKLDPAGNETVLFTFSILSPSPNGPGAGVIMDSKGDFFGTTLNGGGLTNDGTVFELSASGTLTTLHSLVISPTDGGIPFSGLVMDKKGNLYGTTTQGGSCLFFSGPYINCGVVFKVDKSGHETVLHDFAGTDGSNPFGGLIMDKKGNLYGTTAQGGAAPTCPLYPAPGCGTVFKITPH